MPPRRPQRARADTRPGDPAVMVRFTTDAVGRVTELEGDWAAFARPMGASGEAGADGQRSVWDVLAGESVESAFRQLLKQARADGGAVLVPYAREQGAPPHNQLLRIAPRADGDGFEWRLVSIPAREQLIPVCAWCGRARTPDGWVPFDAFLLAGGHFLSDIIQGLSHGICPECKAAAFGLPSEHPQL